MTAACSGFVFALAMADKLIASGAYQNGMVIGAETLSKLVNWQDRATAVLLETELVACYWKPVKINMF